MKISVVNQSTVGYGSDLSMRFYFNEAKARGHDVYWNEVDSDIDYHILGMFFAPMEQKLKEVLKPHSYTYIEHSLEVCQPYSNWLRDWVIPNSIKTYFFSPRHRQHIEDGLPGNYKHLARNNVDYLVVPVDYNVFKPNPNVQRINNLFIFVGMIHVNKGIIDILNIARQHPENEYWFIGRPEGSNFNLSLFDQVPNTKYLGYKSQKELVDIYSQAKGCYILPTNGAVESASRTVFEAVLCGCTPITNRDVGNTSYSWYKNRDKIIENMNNSVDNLFNMINFGYEKYSNHLTSICMLTIKTKEEVQERIDDAVEHATGNFEFIFVSNPDGGVAENRNACLKKTKGDFICFIDDDLYNFPQGWNEILLDMFLSSEDILLVGPRLLNMGNVVQHTNSHAPDDLDVDCIEVEMLPFQCIVYKKNDLFFDEEYKKWGYVDADFVCRLKEKNENKKLLLCNKVLLNHKNESKHMMDNLEENKARFLNRWGRVYE